MKKITLIFIASLFIFGCSSEKTALDEIVELRCNCLMLFEKEKNNFEEMRDCLLEVNAREEFKNLSEIEIEEQMEINCPEAALDKR